MMKRKLTRIKAKGIKFKNDEVGRLSQNKSNSQHLQLFLVVNNLDSLSQPPKTIKNSALTRNAYQLTTVLTRNLVYFIFRAVL